MLANRSLLLRSVQNNRHQSAKWKMQTQTEWDPQDKTHIMGGRSFCPRIHELATCWSSRLLVHVQPAKPMGCNRRPLSNNHGSGQRDSPGTEVFQTLPSASMIVGGRICPQTWLGAHVLPSSKRGSLKISICGSPFQREAKKEATHSEGPNRLTIPTPGNINVSSRSELASANPGLGFLQLIAYRDPFCEICEARLKE